MGLRLAEIAAHQAVSSATARSSVDHEDLARIGEGLQGFRLTFRQVRLTKAGDGILPEITGAEAARKGSRAELRGLVTITAPVIYGRLDVGPAIVEFASPFGCSRDDWMQVNNVDLALLAVEQGAASSGLCPAARFRGMDRCFRRPPRRPHCAALHRCWFQPKWKAPTPFPPWERSSPDRVMLQRSRTCMSECDHGQDREHQLPRHDRVCPGGGTA